MADSREQSAAATIERTWLSYKDRQLFKTIKYAICSSEHSLTHEVLRKLSPRESSLLKDPSLTTKVKFRLDGTRWPPFIVFKIFSKSQSVCYISGKNMLRPSTEAAEDARQLMGNRVYFNQFLSDTYTHHQLSITDIHDIGTVKDYMKYAANLDETPAVHGGKENYWRRLELENLPRVELSSVHTKYWSVADRPVSASSTEPLSTSSSSYLSTPVRSESVSRRQTTTPTSASSLERARGSRLAMKRVNKMRQSFTNGHTPTKEQVEDDDTLLEEEDDVEIMELFQWTQDLSLEELNN
ncbi:PREDICTED: putative uncharacterized protein CXorf58 [Amphimedon queenslandica]|uniref:Uncharacterized protein n=1 Tax=Amphimedon queenslandica TaxID=400682 RepID=A0A1X7TW27_AMPQE|nr:PREDICTED: putative uncharacterized protein CXorf58 [Amphimedon queenslandica]|eukprot:XP_003389727.1 PREDICTED: putative uncharacterized protein CXorf58 [Amphimedon queenslandica]